MMMSFLVLMEPTLPNGNGHQPLFLVGRKW